MYCKGEDMRQLLPRTERVQKEYALPGTEAHYLVIQPAKKLSVRTITYAY
jgi:hypothetical protein